MFGVISTAVFDRSINTIYAMGGAAQFIALSMKDGSTIWTLFLNVTASVDPTLLSNYAALTLYNDTVYVPFASHCDIGDYQGRLIAISVHTRSVRSVFYPSIGPGGIAFGGGIWGSGGVAIGTALLSDAIWQRYQPSRRVDQLL